jgi:hypothetical protein
MRTYETTNNQLQINTIRESILELSRQLYAPSAPSRLNCVFTVLTIQEAIRFRNTHQRTNLIYEVIPVSESPPTHIGDYELAITRFNGPYFQRMFDFAREYWTVPPLANQEALFGCPVQIVAQCPAPLPATP